MFSVKKLTRKTGPILGLSIACAFIGLPPAVATETVPSTAASTTLAQADTTDASDPNAISAETRAKIEELLAITTSNDLNTQIVEGIIGQFRQISPDVPDEWWDRFADKIDYDELNAIVIPIYAQNFTDEELDGIIAFYRTPVGQSVLEKMPAVIQDSLTAGQSWGIRIAQEIISDLEADGYDLPTP